MCAVTPRHCANTWSAVPFMCLNPVFLAKERISVPCGKCFECRVQRSIEWSYRIAQEASLYNENCMVTLTYNDEFLPSDLSVSPREITLFMKRLRKAISPAVVRFFGCGEYGAKRLRPHYHIILFGYDFSDRYLFKIDKKGTPLFRSPLLEKVWTFGFSSVVDVTVEVARYVAVYLQKPPVDGRHRPFVQMSRRPGIGANAVRPNWLETDKMYFRGKYLRLPRYYLTLFERQGYDLTELRARRLANAKQVTFFHLSCPRDFFVQRAQKIRKIERIFKKRLDKNFMV